MKRIRTIIVAMLVAISLSSVSCRKQGEEDVVYLEVNANNISGKWELVEWSGTPFNDGTYIFLDIVRNDRTFTMYQNVDSFVDMPHVVTGSYYLENDPMLGAVIRGNYDHDAGDWSHRYIISGLTETSMTWTAKDDDTFVQKFQRVETIPVAPDQE